LLTSVPPVFSGGRYRFKRHSFKLPSHKCQKRMQCPGLRHPDAIMAYALSFKVV
jgi:hypothetical protein